MRRVSTLALLAFAVASHAGAQCVIFPLEHYLADERIAAVLQVRVLDANAVATGQLVSVEVLRLWKGDSSRRVTIYFRERGVHEGEVDLRAGEVFLIFAHRLTAAERQEIGIQEAEPALGTSNCLAYPFDGARQILGDTPGYPPK